MRSHIVSYRTVCVQWLRRHNATVRPVATNALHRLLDVTFLLRIAGYCGLRKTVKVRNNTSINGWPAFDGSMPFWQPSCITNFCLVIVFILL